jgi:hypothetical protein
MIIVLGMFVLTSCGTSSKNQELPLDNQEDNSGMGFSLLAPYIIGEVLEVKNDGNLSILV